MPRIELRDIFRGESRRAVVNAVHRKKREAWRKFVSDNKDDSWGLLYKLVVKKRSMAQIVSTVKVDEVFTAGTEETGLRRWIHCSREIMRGQILRNRERYTVMS